MRPWSGLRSNSTVTLARSARAADLCVKVLHSGNAFTASGTFRQAPAPMAEKLREKEAQLCGPA